MNSSLLTEQRNLYNEAQSSSAEQHDEGSFMTRPLHSSFAPRQHHPLRHHNSSSSMTCKKDLLTVFQAAPLAWVSAADDVAHPMKAIDFEFERDLLTRTFQECAGSSINVEYEIANTDRLGFFLAREEGHILHFSCHGHPTYLALEDEWGGLAMLETQRLQEWVAAGGKNLQFVFVSACHSSLIGDAFVKAGVPHVLCCRYDSMLREDAAVEFEKSFYRNLALGKTLQYAFDLACHEILVCPRIPEEARLAEVEKFCLLPEGRNHNVQIFYQQERISKLASIPRRKRHVPPVHFPLPPQIVMGRELDQYKVLQALKNSRLVRVTGVRGIGKSALVQSCCRYMNERLHMVDFHEILWVPGSQSSTTTATTENVPFSIFAELFEIINNEEDDSLPAISFLTKARDCITRLVEYFHVRKTLLVVDAKQFVLNSDILRLCLFVEELMKGTRYLKVLAIHHIGYEITTPRMPVSEESVYLEPLDFHSALALFARLCPLCTPSASVPIAVMLQEQEQHGSAAGRKMSRRVSDIFQTVGGGIPHDIHQIAKTMTPNGYEQLLSLIRQKEEYFQCNSRAQILSRQNELTEEITRAAKCRDFQKAKELQSFHDDLEAQKGDFPDIAELREQFDEMTYQIELAITAKDFNRAQALQDDLDKLDASIRMESDVEKLASAENNKDAKLLQTRASLEARLVQLEENYQQACDANDFPSAREIDAESKRLENARNQLPSRADYAHKANTLKGELENAKAERNIDAAEMIYNRLVKVKAKLKLEEKAEAALGIDVGRSKKKALKTQKTSPPRRTTTAGLDDTSPLPPRRQGSTKNDPFDARAGISEQSVDSGESSGATVKSVDPPGALGSPPQSPKKRLVPRRTREEIEVEKAATTSATIEDRSKTAEREDDEDEDSSASLHPGAVRVDGPDAQQGEDETVYSDERTDIPAILPSPLPTSYKDSNGLVKAELVQEQMDLEQIILDTIQKHTVEAVDVTSDVATAKVATAKNKKGFKKYFKRWSKKKK